MTQLTLNLIKSKFPCKDGWAKLLESLNKTRASELPVSIAHILESNGIEDTLWVIFHCINGMLEQKLGMLKEIGESQLHLWEKERGDTTVRNYLNVCCDINSTEEERDAAREAGAAAGAARETAYAAREAAGYAARAAAGEAAGDAAWYARDAAWYAAWYAGDAAWYAREAELKKQKQIILKYFGNV